MGSNEALCLSVCLCIISLIHSENCAGLQLFLWCSVIVAAVMNPVRAKPNSTLHTDSLKTKYSTVLNYQVGIQNVFSSKRIIWVKCTKEEKQGVMLQNNYGFMSRELIFTFLVLGSTFSHQSKCYPLCSIESYQNLTTFFSDAPCGIFDPYFSRWSYETPARFSRDRKQRAIPQCMNKCNNLNTTSPKLHSYGNVIKML